MEGIHSIAKPAEPRPRQRLFTVFILAAMVLPYSGPGICTVLGRTGMDIHEMGMTAEAGNAALQPAGSSMECCSMDGCGAPHAGPVAFSFQVPPGLQQHMVASVTVQSDPPPEYPSLIERPPKA